LFLPLFHFKTKKEVMENWENGLKDVAITVIDSNGKIVDMNTHSKEVNLKDVNQSIIGNDIMDCHPERAQKIIKNMMTNHVNNVYTITKKGQEKLIYQSPWYNADGSFGGLVELSIVIPNNMPHYDRDKK
jgi:transcriptional regulator with PAS, ATPase and Fis domain